MVGSLWAQQCPLRADGWQVQKFLVKWNDSAQETEQEPEYGDSYNRPYVRRWRYTPASTTAEAASSQTLQVRARLVWRRDQGSTSRAAASLRYSELGWASVSSFRCSSRATLSNGLGTATTSNADGTSHEALAEPTLTATVPEAARDAGVFELPVRSLSATGTIPAQPAQEDGYNAYVGSMLWYGVQVLEGTTPEPTATPAPEPTGTLPPESQGFFCRIVSPPNGATLPALSSITGSAGAGSNLKRVTVMLGRYPVSAGYPPPEEAITYWWPDHAPQAGWFGENQDAGQGRPWIVASAVSGTYSNWSVPRSNLPVGLSSSYHYFVKAWAVDSANNISPADQHAFDIRPIVNSTPTPAPTATPPNPIAAPQADLYVAPGESRAGEKTGGVVGGKVRAVLRLRLPAGTRVD